MQAWPPGKASWVFLSQNQQTQLLCLVAECKDLLNMSLICQFRGAYCGIIVTGNIALTCIVTPLNTDFSIDCWRTWFVYETREYSRYRVGQKDKCWAPARAFRRLKVKPLNTHIHTRTEWKVSSPWHDSRCLTCPCTSSYVSFRLWGLSSDCLWSLQSEKTSLHFAGHLGPSPQLSPLPNRFPSGLLSHCESG